MKQLPLSKLQSLFAAVSAAQKLYIPADDAAGQASFTVWQEGMTLTKSSTPSARPRICFPAGGKPCRLPCDGQTA